MMRAYQLLRGGLIRLLEWTLVVMVVVITFDVLWGVWTRNAADIAAAITTYTGLVIPSGLVPQGQAPYTDELARVLLVWISMLGGALAFARKAHLGVDFFVNKMHPDARKALAILVQGVTVSLAVIVFIIGGTALAQGQWTQKLPTMPWLTKGAVYAVIPVAGIFILMFSLENLVAVIRTPASRWGEQTKSEG